MWYDVHMVCMSYAYDMHMKCMWYAYDMHTIHVTSIFPENKDKLYVVELTSVASHTLHSKWKLISY